MTEALEINAAVSAKKIRVHWSKERWFVVWKGFIVAEFADTDLAVRLAMDTAHNLSRLDGPADISVQAPPEPLERFRRIASSIPLYKGKLIQ